MFQRADIEARERTTLAPYALLSGNSSGRRHAEPDDPHRTMYQRDRDRILHSRAFRRLEYKTQVFVYHEGDYYRTRLTHSLEVAQIARSVACALGVNETFVEALALAHDLGHPPFGHAGGEMLHQRMRDHGGFEHNVQGLRIVDRLERRYPGFPGLNLSFELREAILKHGPTGSDAQTAEFSPPRPPALETILVDLADSTAYNHHDLDDGLRSGILDLHDLATEVPLFGRCLESAVRDIGSGNESDVRLVAINRIVKAMIADLIETSRAKLAAASPADSLAARNDSRAPLIAFSIGMERDLEILQEYLFTKFYRHYRVVRMMDKAKRLLAALFDAYVERPELLPPEFQAWADREGIQRAVCDYLAGMTDRYAEQDYRKLFDPSERV
jgi:dGTPase